MHAAEGVRHKAEVCDLVRKALRRLHFGFTSMKRGLVRAAISQRRASRNRPLVRYLLPFLAPAFL
jgi:hypothetical protein